MAVCLSMLGTSLNPLASNQGALAQSNPLQKYYLVQLYTNDMMHLVCQQHILTNHPTTEGLEPTALKIEVEIADLS